MITGDNINILKTVSFHHWLSTYTVLRKRVSRWICRAIWSDMLESLIMHTCSITSITITVMANARQTVTPTPWTI